MLLIKQCSMHVIHLIYIQGRYSMHAILLKGQCHKFCSSGFFMGQSPQPQSTPLGQFRICLQIRGDICKSRCTTISTTPATSFAISFAGVVDTGGKFATGVNDTGSKFATSVNNTGGNLPPVTMMPMATCHQYQQHRSQICHQWQTMGTVSDCWQHKMSLKEKCICVLNLLPKCVQKK